MKEKVENVFPQVKSSKEFNTSNDTRNRWQRMNDANYDKKLHKIQKVNQPISRATFNALLKRYGNTNLDRFSHLSRVGGHTKRHPRTKQLIQMQTSEVIKPKLQPRQAYHRKQHRSEQQISATIQNGKLFVAIETRIRTIPYWKTVWFTANNRRK